MEKSRAVTARGGARRPHRRQSAQGRQRRRQGNRDRQRDHHVTQGEVPRRQHGAQRRHLRWTPTTASSRCPARRRRRPPTTSRSAWRARPTASSASRIGSRCSRRRRAERSGRRHSRRPRLRVGGGARAAAVPARARSTAARDSAPTTKPAHDHQQRRKAVPGQQIARAVRAAVGAHAGNAASCRRSPARPRRRPPACSRRQHPPSARRPRPEAMSAALSRAILRAAAIVRCAGTMGGGSPIKSITDGSACTVRCPRPRGTRDLSVSDLTPSHPPPDHAASDPPLVTTTPSSPPCMTSRSRVPNCIVIAVCGRRVIHVACHPAKAGAAPIFATWEFVRGTALAGPRRVRRGNS